MDEQKENEKQTEELNSTKSHDISKKLEATGWGLFFIWIGIAFLANFDFGLGLLGVGIITLGGQAARKYFNLKVEGFWLVVGLLFLLGAVWDLLEGKLALVPILIILAGLLLIYSAFSGKRK